MASLHVPDAQQKKPVHIVGLTSCYGLATLTITALIFKLSLGFKIN